MQPAAMQSTGALPSTSPVALHRGAKKDKAKAVSNCKRHTLSASISAEALRRQETEMEATRRPQQFAITDLLLANNQKATRTATSHSSACGAPLGPLQSPQRANDAQAPVSFVEVSSTTTRASKALVSPVKTTWLREKYSEKLETAENVELFAYASALCHRVTGRYLPRRLLEEDSEAQQRELKRVQRDPEILRAIDSVRVLSAQFKEVACDTMGHRKELGHTLFRIEESYLKLFEKLLELSLRLYWEYEHATEAQREADRAATVHWQEQFERKSAECVRLNKKFAAREIVQRAQQVELDDCRRQIKELESEVASKRELEVQIRELLETVAQKRALERQLQDDLAQLKKVHEGMVEYQQAQQKEMRVRQKQVVSELRKVVREKEQFISKQEVELRELVAEVSIVRESRSSQTEVDDDGLWDVQDGVPRFVSKSVLHKMMWRRFNAFVACKNCGGRPLPSITKTNPLVRDATREEGNEEVDVWSVERVKKLSKKAAKRIERIEQQWELPSQIVLFLSNLPKSVMAFPFYSLEQVITQIEAIYDDKFDSDKVDESDGVAREELPRFICEFFLKTHGLRQSAEVGLYRFLVSVKNTFHRSSHIRLFARLSNLLKSEDIDADTAAAAAQPKQEKENADATSPTVTKRRQPSTISAAEAPASQPEIKNMRRTGYLDRTFLRVFLAARHYLLRPPPPEPPKVKKTRRQSEAATVPRPVLHEHVVQVDRIKKWVPLDHAITVLRWYIHDMPEDSIVAYCREVEYSTAIYDGRTITEVAGNRLAVRAEMRRAMLAGDEASGSTFTTTLASEASDDEAQRRRRTVAPRIVADVHKVLLLLMSALEQHQDGMKRDLIALFDEGDVNHDRVLSLDEFRSIIRIRMPHFSDRRILRMFREALMGGVNQSFALSMEAFVVVCNDHGLVSLLPDDRMQDPFAPPPEQAVSLLSEGRRGSRGSVVMEGRRGSRGSIVLPAKHKVEFVAPIEASTFVEIPEEIEQPAPLFSARAEEVMEDEHAGWR